MHLLPVTDEARTARFDRFVVRGVVAAGEEICYNLRQLSNLAST